MDLRTLLVAAALTLALVGCSSIRVATDYDSEADFSNLHTWKWMMRAGDVPDDPRFNAEFLRSRIEEAVVAEMTARGYEKIEDGMADILIGYHVVVEDKVDVATFDNYYGYPGSWYYQPTPYRYRETQVRTYQMGTLILDIANGTTKRLIWRGSAEAEVEKAASPEERTERIREGVKKILDRFPPD